MRFGVCTNLSNASAVIQAGFDYVETGAVDIAKTEAWDPKPYQESRVEATNLFFPGDIDLYGSKNWQEYSLRLFKRTKEIGVSVMVIGSGGVRKSRPQSSIVDGLHGLLSGSKIPMNPRKAEEAFIRIVGQMQKSTSIPLAPESLNRSETDCYNDCMTLARDTEKAKVGYTADAYHILYEWDKNGRSGGKDFPDEFFWQDQLPYAPTHCHLAALEGRAVPKADDPMITGFFQRLQKLGYTGRVSLECNGLGPESYVEALEVLRSYVAS